MNLFKLFEAYVNRVGLDTAAAAFGVTAARVKQVMVSGTPTLAMFEKAFNAEGLTVTKGDVAVTAASPSVSEDPNPVSEDPKYEVAEYPQWANRKLAILSCTNRAYDHVAFSSITKLIDNKLMAVKSVYCNFGIVRGRNQLADWFLRSNLEWSFWVDDDMILQCGDADFFKTEVGLPELSNGVASLHTIFQLLSRQKTLIGGCYFGRHPKGEAVMSERHKPHINYLTRQGPANQVIPANWIGFGAALVHRSVFEDIIKKYPEIRIEDDKLAQAYGYRYGFFDSVEQTLGEDISFCRRAKEAGHTTFVDLMITPGHAGRQVYNFKNTLPK